MMKVSILRQVLLAGKTVFPGEIHEVSRSDARILTNSGSAVLYEEPEQIKEETKPAAQAKPKTTRKRTQK